MDALMGRKGGKAVEIDVRQGGDKAAERPGANRGIVEHAQVDKIDHGGIAGRAKGAASEMGHYNVSYYDGGHKG